MKIRLPIFLGAAVIVMSGIAGAGQLEKHAGLGFLIGALTLGGGLFICGLFSIRMLWLGMLGAGVLALLGLGRGAFNFPGAMDYVFGERARGVAPLLELGVTVVCAFLLIHIWQAWKRERNRRLLGVE